MLPWIGQNSSLVTLHQIECDNSVLSLSFLQHNCFFNCYLIYQLSGKKYLQKIISFFSLRGEMVTPSHFWEAGGSVGLLPTETPRSVNRNIPGPLSNCCRSIPASFPNLRESFLRSNFGQQSSPEPRPLRFSYTRSNAKAWSSNGGDAAKTDTDTQDIYVSQYILQNNYISKDY